jgi:hypothetical protein
MSIAWFSRPGLLKSMVVLLVIFAACGPVPSAPAPTTAPAQPTAAPAATTAPQPAAPTTAASKPTAPAAAPTSAPAAPTSAPASAAAPGAEWDQTVQQAKTEGALVVYLGRAGSR